MADRRLRSAAAAALVVLYGAPLGLLVLRAVADVWRHPNLWPQELGMRGITYAFSTVGGAAPAVRNSLVVALVTTGLAAVLAWPASRVIARGRRRARAGLIVLIGLPLLVPPLAVGQGLNVWFLRLGLVDGLAGLVAAHLVYVLPYVTLLLSVGFTQRVTDLEEAASTLGASGARRLRHVTLPAVAPALAFALLLGFLVSWSQYGTSLAVGGGVPMLPLLLVPFVEHDPQVASTLALVFLTPAVVALVTASRLGRHR